MNEKFRIKKVSKPKEILMCRWIRERVFCEEQNVSKEAEFDGLDDVSDHFLCFKDSVAVGTGRLRKKDSGEYKIERMAVIETERCKGIGKLIMDAIVNEWIKKRSTEILILHSQIQVKPFYEQLGFKSVGSVFFEEDICHVKMVFDLRHYYRERQE